ncbi:MAG: ribonuclease R [Alphaproteobacteria bacterium]|nr:ribonuclease R [Alphaproteobacteria bacterium]
MAARDHKHPRSNRLPDREELLAYIRDNDGETVRRDIARAFGVRGAQRAELRALLRELEDAGLIERGQGRNWRPSDSLPPVAVLEVYDLDKDGEPLLRPVSWAADQPPPAIDLLAGPRNMAAPGIGERILCRLQPRGEDGYSATPMRRVNAQAQHLIGVYRQAGDGGRVMSTERRARHEMFVAADHTDGAQDGELVAVELLPGRRNGMTRVNITERIGDASAPTAISLIAIHRAGIPVEFPEAVLDAAESATPPSLGNRTDLRDLALVTIDGADARDFDDAVFAEPDDDKENSGGWHLTVAIADVAWFVRPDGVIDREAYRRGNSVYFPDRVVPMLPAALSNGLCSLVPGEDRACLTADLWISRDGSLLRHRFQRALMTSAARLTYEQVEGTRTGGSTPVAVAVIDNLYGAFKSLTRERKRRGTLELELPERKVVLDGQGKVQSIVSDARLDSHRLIEEFMITANVAAARELIGLRQPAMFRIHDEPDREKLRELREVLAEFGVRLPKAKIFRSADFNALLTKVGDQPHARLINELILRAQSQAEYNPENIGHFGLGLRNYAHFTSPIRRYADLLVHRAIIRGLRLGADALPDDGLPDDAGEKFVEIGEHISATERRAVGAERDANDRYAASYLAQHIGNAFTGVIRGIARAGLFVALDDNGAEGFIPASRLPNDRYYFDSATQTLRGAQSGLTYRLGDNVEVRIAEADGLTSSAIFDLLDGGNRSPIRAREHNRPARKSRRGRRSKQR